MAKLTRKTAKVFGATASTSGTNPDIGQFGSAKAGTYVGTGDIDSIQALTAWSNGWIDAVTPTQQFPTLPEMTGVHKVLSYQETYLLQEGVPEYDVGTTYYTDSLCKGKNAANELTLFRSKADENTGNALTNTTYWEEFNPAANRELSNLTTTGNNRLHALKSYEDAGETLTDGEGYADVLKYAHSTFDSSKFTTVGTLTNTNGVISGFSGSNLMQIANSYMSQLVGTTNFIFKMRFKTKSTLTAGLVLGFGNQAQNGTFSLYVSASSVVPIIFTDDNGTATQTLPGSVTKTINTDTEYEIYFSKTGTAYGFGIRALSESSFTTSAGTTSANPIYAATQTIGRSTTADSIDIKYLSVIADGAVVFSGNVTGTDTYTINGSTVTIPFTWSKTGSKIVNSYYASSVADLYAQEGIAPYYLLDDINSTFALPQGEIYGMIQRNSSGNNAMPSLSKSLTLGTSGSTYTAPAAGYFQFSKIAGTTSTFIKLKSDKLAASSIPNGASDYLDVFLPVKKGEVVTVTYNATGATETFAFVYTTGAEMEA